MHEATLAGASLHACCLPCAPLEYYGSLLIIGWTIPGAAQAQPSELRLSSEPLPQRAASGHLEGGEAQGGGEMLTSAGVVQEAARQALAMAERHRLQASGEQQPQRDGEPQSVLLP